MAGNPGNAGGTGRPSSAIRDRVRGSFDERIPILEAIADGQVMQRIEVPLHAVLPHVVCPSCGEQGVEANGPEKLLLVTIEGQVSAAPRDRIASLKVMADIGIPAVRELSIELVRERIQKMLEILRSELAPPVMKRLEPKLRDAWVSK